MDQIYRARSSEPSKTFQGIFRASSFVESPSASSTKCNNPRSALSFEYTRQFYQFSYDERQDESSEFEVPRCRSRQLSHDQRDDPHNYEFADSRDPEEHIPHSRSSRDDERTAMPYSDRDTSISGRNSGDGASTNGFAIPMLGNGTLKRANPIYESENECEHQREISGQQASKRRSILCSEATTTMPIYWSERLPVE